MLVIVVITLAILAFKYKNNTSPKKKENQPVEKIKIDPSVPDISLPFSNEPKDVAWAVFQEYLSYNKTRNLEGVKSVVYKIAPICQNPKNKTDCENRMGSAYSYGSLLKKEDFINVWSDEKQTILTTDFKIEENDNTIGRSRAIIFFVKDEKRKLRMLSFSPFKGAITEKGEASEEELNDRLVIFTEDKDEDGVADYQEQCLGLKKGETCISTNPKLRDTNGDSWWDGVEALMK